MFWNVKEWRELNTDKRLWDLVPVKGIQKIARCGYRENWRTILEGKWVRALKIYRAVNVQYSSKSL